MIYSKTAVITILFVCISLIGAVFSAGTDRIAFSLKSGLHRTLRGTSQPKIKNLGGMTNLEGFIVDKKRKDIIFFGAVDPARPPLVFEDALIALKNVFQYYNDKSDGKSVYKKPGCSIRPGAPAMMSLSQIAKQASELGPTAYTAKKRLYGDYLNQCIRNREVTVFGVPFNSHFSDVMVRADRKLKSIIAGKMPNGVDNHEHWSWGYIEQASKNLYKKRPLVFANTRYWLYPKEFRYKSGEDTYIIAASKIQLLAESQYFKATKQKSKAKLEKYAKAFAQSFTEQFSKIQQAVPEFYEVENVFKWMMIAQQIEILDAEQKVPFRLRQQLVGFKASYVQVPKSVEGFGALKEFEALKRSEVYKSAAPICGGIHIDIHPKDDGASRKEAVRIVKWHADILRQRPHRAVVWAVSNLLNQDF